MLEQPGYVRAEVKIRRKKIWLAAALLIVVAVAAVWWLAKPSEPAQFITLSNGQRYRFAGVTYGTNHTQPRLLAQVVDHLPNNLAVYLRKHYCARWNFLPPLATAEPSLCLWFEPVDINGKATKLVRSTFVNNVSAMLANDHGILAGETASSFVPLTGWFQTEFTKWPRRSAMLECDFQEPGKLPISNLSPWSNTIKFRNPRPGRFPQWQPEPLPAVKSVGDIEVRLERVFGTTANVGAFWAGEPRFWLQLTSPRSNERWVLDNLELSDATGNRFTGALTSGDLLPGLSGKCWPDESAIRMKLGIKKTSGFSALELITFTNVPLLVSSGSAATRLSITNFAGGLPIVLHNQPFLPAAWVGRKNPNSAWLAAEALVATKDVAACIVKVETDTGAQPDEGTPHGNGYEYNSVPAGTKYLNITVAVQKMRYVEFLVKPERE